MTDKAAICARLRDEALSAPPLTADERAEFRCAIAREYQRSLGQNCPQQQLKLQEKTE